MSKNIMNLVLIPLLLFYAIPAGAAEKEERTWESEMIYSLMIDRFSNGDIKNDFQLNVKDPEAYAGGDFAGVTDKLDYIKDMGFTSIMLSPVFDNEKNGYHGYWINDFEKVEEQFGTMADLKNLVKEAHKKDLKVILEFPVNSVGPNHPWLVDPDKKAWFHEKNTNETDKEKEWINGLPDLAQENPETREYLLNAAKWWVEETNVDGYKLDAVEYVAEDFLLEMANTVKAVKNDFYVIATTLENNPNYSEVLKSNGVEGMYVANSNEKLIEAFADIDKSAKQLFTDVNYEAISFFDNEDTVRFTHEAESNNHHPGTRWKMALTYLYTTPGPSSVFYGTEIALNGAEIPDNRGLMGFKADQDLIDYMKKLGELRTQLPSLVDGDLELLYEENGMTIYKRTGKEETSVVAINNTAKTQTIELDDSVLEKDKELRGMLAGDLSKSNDGVYKIVLDRETSEVYVLAEKSGINIPYLVWMAVVYIAFAAFLIIVFKRSKRKKEQS